ncbi:CHAD domain-containing protein [Kitasatospora sp. NPDC004240]
MAARTRSGGTVGEAVLARLGEQAEALAGLDEAVRADEPDAVHRMRVACRRLRSALRTYRRLLRGDAGEHLIGELRWLGQVLGRARDQEVLTERLVARARELPAECGPQRMAEALERWGREEYRRAWPEAVAVLDSPRRRLLGEELAALLAQPPLRGRAGRDAVPELARIAAKEQRRVAERVRAALAEPGGPEADARLHDARKAAKRARYAGETAQSVAGKAARRFTERMKAVQEVLGEHQDAVVAAAALRGRLAGVDGREDAFAYGALYGEQLAAAEAARQELPAVWQPAGRPKLVRWS